DAHPRVGGRIAVWTLESAGFDGEIAQRVEQLVLRDEHHTVDPELALLNDADALSFFSLNSAGFFDYFGPLHARRKIRYTLDRMSPRNRARLSTLRLRDDVARLLTEEVAS